MYYFSKVLFSGFLQFKDTFVDGQNNPKYRDVETGLIFVFTLENEEESPEERGTKSSLMVMRGVTSQNKSKRELHKPVFRSTYRAFVVCLSVSLKTAAKKKIVQRFKTIMIMWNPRACHLFYLHLMKWMLTQEMYGGQVQRSGAHTALCTFKYLRTSKRENCVTCVTVACNTWDKKELCEQIKTNGFLRNK